MNSSPFHGLAEWYFRSSLDRYIWIFGMLCAWAHPFADKALNVIDEMSLRSKLFARAVILGLTAVLFSAWCAAAEVTQILGLALLHVPLGTDTSGAAVLQLSLASILAGR